MDYKVVFDPCFGRSALYESEHETQTEAEAVLNAIANYTLMLHEASLMSDHSNFGAVQKRDGNGYWFEIDGDGNFI